MIKLFVSRFISNFGNGMGLIALAFSILSLPDGSAYLLGLVLGTTTVLFFVGASFWWAPVAQRVEQLAID